MAFLLDSGFRFGVEGKAGEGWPSWDGAERKQAVLSVAFRYLDTYRELLQEEGERSNSFPKVLVQHTLLEYIHTDTPRTHTQTAIQQDDGVRSNNSAVLNTHFTSAHTHTCSSIQAAWHQGSVLWRSLWVGAVCGVLILAAAC